MTEQPTFEDRTATAAIIDFVRDRLLSIVGLLCLAGAAAVFLGVDPEVPRNVRLIGFTALAFVPVGWITGNWILGILYQPNWRFIVDLDATRIDGALYRLPPDDFTELTVTDDTGDPDSPYQITQLTNKLYAAKQVDIEQLTCVGTWRGSLDDRDLLRSLQKVEECRGMLEEDAKRGFVIESQAWTIIRGATRSAVRNVVETFERGSLPDEGTGINQEIDSALEQFNLDSHLDTDIKSPEADPDSAPPGERDTDTDTDPKTNGHTEEQKVDLENND